VNDDRKPEQEERSWLDRLTHFISGEPQNKSDLTDLLSLAEEHEIIDEDARKIMEGALSVTDMQVRDIMIPRAQMVVIDSDQPLQEAIPQIIQAGHSRYPVIGDGIDDVIGILLAKDLLPLVQTHMDVPSIKALMRPVIAVPESKRLNVLLREFRQNRNHMAIVIDEYGGLGGVVTIEDVLEQIVGEIEDEYDVDEEDYIKKVDSDNYTVKALTPIEDFNNFFHSKLPDDEFDTIGGLVLDLFRHIPERDETVGIGPYVFKVLNADNRQIRLLLVTTVFTEENPEPA
jgi:magnesium and cobalt transporter